MRHPDELHVALAVTGITMVISAALFYMGIRSLRELLRPVKIEVV